MKPAHNQPTNNNKNKSSEFIIRTQGYNTEYKEKDSVSLSGNRSRNKRDSGKNIFSSLFLLCPYLFITFFSLSNISLPSLSLTHTALSFFPCLLSSQHNISSLQWSRISLVYMLKNPSVHIFSLKHNKFT